jgi:hypothetical protein
LADGIGDHGHATPPSQWLAYLLYYSTNVLSTAGASHGAGAVLAEISVSTVVESEYLTLEEAARLAGHASASTLRAAARSGRLKTVKFSPQGVPTSMI